MLFALLLTLLFLAAHSPLSSQSLFDAPQLPSPLLLRTTISMPKPSPSSYPVGGLPAQHKSAEGAGPSSPPYYSNTVNKPLIVFCAPQRSNYEYRSRFDDLIDFFANLTLNVLLPRGENVLILADTETRPYFLAKSIPDDVLLNANLSSIFLRDYAPVRANRPVRFRYQPLHLPDYAAKNISNALDAFFSAYRLPLEHYSGLILDGGNVVDNGIDRAIVTDRVIYDNTPGYNNDQINLMLSDALGYTDIAILSELTGDILGHGGEMLSFIDAQTVALGQLDPWPQQRVFKELRRAFGGLVRVVTVPNHYHDTGVDGGGVEGSSDGGAAGTKTAGSAKMWHGLPTACGLYVNMLLTDTSVYLPQFGPPPSPSSAAAVASKQFNRPSITNPTNQRTGTNLNSANQDRQVRTIIEKNTGRTVVPIHMPSSICSMGVSLRRISWQVKGNLADRLIWLARKY